MFRASLGRMHPGLCPQHGPDWGKGVCASLRQGEEKLKYFLNEPEGTVAED